MSLSVRNTMYRIGEYLLAFRGAKWLRGTRIRYWFFFLANQQEFQL